MHMHTFAMQAESHVWATVNNLHASLARLYKWPRV